MHLNQSQSYGASPAICVLPNTDEHTPP